MKKTDSLLVAGQVAGQDVGRNVAHYVMDHYLKPRDDGDEQSGAVAADVALVNVSLHANQVQPLPAATERPSLLQPPQPTEVLAATSMDKDQPIRDAGAWDRLAARALADLDDGMFADPLRGEEVFA